VLRLLPILLCACAAGQRSIAAHLLNCPVEQVTAVLGEEPSAGERALEAAEAEASATVPPHTVIRDPVAPRDAIYGAIWDGCGKSALCHDDSCAETGESRRAQEIRRVPVLMEKSRAALAPDGTAIRDGLVTWSLKRSDFSLHCAAWKDSYDCHLPGGE
jgi:hypothetical protein